MNHQCSLVMAHGEPYRHFSLLTVLQQVRDERCIHSQLNFLNYCYESMKIGVVEFHPQRRRGAFGPLQLVVCVNCFGKWWLVSACMRKMKCDKEKKPYFTIENRSLKSILISKNKVYMMP